MTALRAVFVAVRVSIVTIAVTVAMMVVVIAAVLAAGYALFNLRNHVRYFAGFGDSAEHDAKD